MKRLSFSLQGFLLTAGFLCLNTPLIQGAAAAEPTAGEIAFRNQAIEALQTARASAATTSAALKTAIAAAQTRNPQFLAQLQALASTQDPLTAQLAEQSLMCPFCTEILDTPLAAHGSDIHAYCQNCLETVINAHMSCPTCRTPITEANSPLVSPERLAQLLLPFAPQPTPIPRPRPAAAAVAAHQAQPTPVLARPSDKNEAVRKLTSWRDAAGNDFRSIEERLKEKLALPENADFVASIKTEALPLSKFDVASAEKRLTCVCGDIVDNPVAAHGDTNHELLCKACLQRTVGNLGGPCPHCRAHTTTANSPEVNKELLAQLLLPFTPGSDAIPTESPYVTNNLTVRRIRDYLALHPDFTLSLPITYVPAEFSPEEQDAYRLFLQLQGLETAMKDRTNPSYLDPILTYQERMLRSQTTLQNAQIEGRLSPLLSVPALTYRSHIMLLNGSLLAEEEKKQLQQLVLRNPHGVHIRLFHNNRLTDAERAFLRQFEAERGRATAAAQPAQAQHSPEALVTEELLHYLLSQYSRKEDLLREIQNEEIIGLINELIQAHCFTLDPLRIQELLYQQAEGQQPVIFHAMSAAPTPHAGGPAAAVAAPIGAVASDEDVLENYIYQNMIVATQQLDESSFDEIMDTLQQEAANGTFGALVLDEITVRNAIDHARTRRH